MPTIGKSPATFVTSKGVYSASAESLPYSLPALDIQLRSGFAGIEPPTGNGLNLKSPDVWCLGTRLVFLKALDKPATPVFVLSSQFNRQAAPWDVYPLHNAVDFTVSVDAATSTVHCFWYWNAWSPDWVTGFTPTPENADSTELQQTQLQTTKLPRPPLDRYAPHSVPHLKAPVWLESVVPRYFVPEFDIRRPFWVAPVVQQWQYDYFVGGVDRLTIGESRINGGSRLSDTPGARYLQNALSRGLLDEPPAEAPFRQTPSPERFDWEARGGIVAAARHIRLASLRDFPVFTPDSLPQNDLQSIPGLETPLPSGTTLEDHLIIVQALKAHQDHRNIENATRVLMHSKANLVQLELAVVPSYLVDKLGGWQSGLWPSTTIPPKTVQTLLLTPPKPVAAFPVMSNYRLTVNPTVVQYPEFGGAQTAFYSNQEGYVISTSTPNVSLEPSLDYVIHDPTPAWAKNANAAFGTPLDVRSF